MAADHRNDGLRSWKGICLQKRYHRSSEMVLMLMPFDCTDKPSQIGQHSLGYFCLCRKHLQRTNYISICLNVHLQPGCFAYARKPSSVVSASKRMERWESLCSF